MFNRLRTRLDAGRQDGFTLIELLIVIVILGILAGIVVFAVGNARSDSELGACQATKSTIETAAEAFKAKSPTGAYPSSVADLAGNANGGPFLKTAPAGWTLSGGNAVKPAGAPSAC